MIALRDWAWRNLQSRPVRAGVVLMVVAAVCVLSYTAWYLDLAGWSAAP